MDLLRDFGVFRTFQKYQLGSNWGQEILDREKSELFDIEKPPNSTELGGFMVAEAGLEPTTSGL